MTRSYLSPVPDEYVDALARAVDRLGPFGRAVRWCAEVGSTNDLAGELAYDGAEEGSVVLAEEQRIGRGRVGRSWSSPAGSGLYVSTILHPPRHVTPLVTIAAGVAIAEGLAAASGLDPCVKWPNDVYLGARKVAGILAEGGLDRQGRPYVVVGFGVNVLNGVHPPDVRSRATSLEAEAGRPIDRGVTLAECLAALAARYQQLRCGLVRPVIDAWRERAASTFGRAVAWDANGTEARGVAENIDEEGALLIRTSNGLVRVLSGEVRWT